MTKSLPKIGRNPLPVGTYGPRIERLWAPGRSRPERMIPESVATGRRGLFMFCVVGLFAVSLSGCALSRPAKTQHHPQHPPLAIAVAPVLNLSNSVDWDPLRVTDMVASELLTFPNIAVIPVNRTLGALELMQRPGVESPEDALDLARELRADATLVVAVTEFSPYDPPILGITAQLYFTQSAPTVVAVDPTVASRTATDFAPAAAVTTARGPVQFQRTFNAADPRVLEEIREYDDDGARDGRNTPFGWRVHTQSQELFIRYSMWSSMRSILRTWAHHGREAGPSDEANR